MKKLSERLAELATKVAGMEKKVAIAEKETSDKVQARVDTAKSDAKARQDAFQARIDEGQADVASHWKELQTSFDSQVEQIKNKIATRQDDRDEKRAIRRADDAEIYAESAIDFALMALSEAEIAVLEAIEARAYADSLS